MVAGSRIFFRFEINMKYYVLSHESAHKGQSGEKIGSTYDLSNACKNCGTGAELVGPLYTKDLKNVKNDCFYTLSDDTLISEKLYKEFSQRNIRLEYISQVVDYKGNPLPYYHLNPKLSFPKMLSQSQGLKTENQCPVCKQNGYFSDVVIGDLEKGIDTYIKPFMFHYADIDKNILNQSDIFHTWEHIGLSNLKAEGYKVIRYARPLLIVNEDVKKIFDNLKIKKISFSEVIIHLHSTELQ